MASDRWQPILRDGLAQATRAYAHRRKRQQWVAYEEMLMAWQGEMGATNTASIDRIFEHRLIKGAAPNRGFLAGDATSVPDYIPVGQFVEVLLQTLSEETHVAAQGQPAEDKRPPRDSDELESLVSKMADDNLRKVIRGILGGVQGDIKEARESIERWFDESMDRVRGSHARHVQRRTRSSNATTG